MLDAKFVPALCNLANLLQKLGKLPAAAELYQKALEIEPDTAAFMLTAVLALEIKAHEAGTAVIVPVPDRTVRLSFVPPGWPLGRALGLLGIVLLAGVGFSSTVPSRQS